MTVPIAVVKPLRLPLILAVGGAVLLAGWGIARAPLHALAAAVALGLLAVFLWRPAAATALLASSFYFDGYLVGENAGLITPSKLIGVVAVVSFALDRLRNPRPLLVTRHVWALLALSAWLLLSITVAYDRTQALVVAGRYAMFFVLFFLVLQSASQHDQADRLVDVVVISSGVAALLGLVAYFSGSVGRASGPLENPNDFGFVLASSVPLALYRLHRGSPWRRVVGGIATMVIFAAILATFSRAALLGLVVAAVWALGTGRLRLRWGVVAMVALLLAGVLAYQVQPDLVRTTLDQKQRVADQNIESRIVFWRVALEQFSTSPLLGVGPGNYQVRYSEFEYPLGDAVKTTHNAYLDVLAELGAPGLVFFLTFVGLSWMTLRSYPTETGDGGRLGDALAAGFVVALVGAMFMTEQYYPPLWFLAALAVARSSTVSEPQLVPAR
jgi:putative inorganic carbon (HCO3(-)) transporter